MAMHKIKINLCLIFPLILSFDAFADSRVDFGPRPYRNAVVSNGGTGQITFITYNRPGTGLPTSVRVGLEAFGYIPNRGNYTAYYERLSTNECNGRLGSRAAAINTITNLMNNRINIPAISFGDPLNLELMENINVEFIYACYDAINRASAGLGRNSRNGEIEIINPPNQKSICTLNDQLLNFNFLSNALDVNSAKQNRNLAINCTSGNARDYTLKLISSKVDTNGNLSFGNGVAAKIALNDINVSANGSGIALNALKTININVTASLTGVALSSGESSASGVLVLEAN
ncbi:hypothetical protein AB7W88_07120 [Providencia vermicola]|uniref:Adhesin n=3 Tax=Providencia TaxID=586 RepID=A0AAX3RW63_9GAMM|nr:MULTISPECIES: hypothetical protein [Providencia]ELR5144303.1 hypothetical protein [Providencia stuartii]ELX8381006.1 hypothetical protein [Providencia stuartii]EMD5260544.1 hypothetical protein [Providencia stuartii]MTB41110.1 hypothetical protein [Providencia sp. wls1949]MTC07006.1 hypothetical protein [Providencia sp. wls1948]